VSVEAAALPLMLKLLLMTTRPGCVLPGPDVQERTEPRRKTPSPPPPPSGDADTDSAARRSCGEERLTESQTEGVFRRFVVEMDGRRRVGRCEQPADAAVRHGGRSSTPALPPPASQSPFSDLPVAAADFDDDDDQLS